MTVTTYHEWAENAACVGYPDEVFFPDSGKSAVVARKICATCPVQTKCLAMALDVEAGPPRNNRYGVFGGLTPSERAGMVGASV